MATVLEGNSAGVGKFTLIQSGERRFTIADVAAMPRRLPSGSVSFELHHGRLVPMSPPGATHGNLQARFGNALVDQGEKKGYGKAYTEVGIVLERGPDHLVGADAAFVVKSSLPVRESSEGYLETIPQLVVEIRSKNDLSAEIAVRVADYLKAGVKLVWVVNDTPDSVTEYRSGTDAKRIGRGETLVCDDIIPGFRYSVADLFAE